VFDTTGLDMAERLDPWTIASAQMAPGERLIWADGALPRTTRRRSTGFVVVGLGLALVALYWTSQAWAAGLAVAWVGVPFTALGIGFASAPWWRRRAPLVYAVSDRRLLIIRAGPKSRVRSFGPADLQDLEIDERPDGSGDLIFRRETMLVPHPVDDKTRNRALPRVRRTGFLGVPDVRRAAAAVRKLKGAPPSSTIAAPGAAK
jgi:hypothetical protein